MRSYAIIGTLAFAASTVFSSPASAQLLNPWSELESKGMDDYTPPAYSNDLGDSSNLASYIPGALLAILLVLSHGGGPSVGGAAIVDPGSPRDPGGSSSTNPGGGSNPAGGGSGSGSNGSGSSGTGGGSGGSGSSGGTGSNGSGGSGGTGGDGGSPGTGGSTDPGRGVSAVPEPSTYMFFVGLGTGAALLVNRKRQMVRS